MAKYRSLFEQRYSRKKVIILCLAAVIIIVGIAIAIYFAVRSSRSESKPRKGKEPFNYSKIEAEEYKTAAVSADAPQCSDIGRNLLKKGGTAVDAAVGALFCVGVINMHSTGVGGGGFAVVYDGKTKKAYAHDYRETAPGAALERMFLKNGTSSTNGGLAIAVPGEIYGLHAMWKEHGKLEWKDLVEPSRKLAEDGFPLGEPLHHAMEASMAKLNANPGLKTLFVRDGRMLKVGETFRNPELAKTLEIIKNDPMSFYKGDLAKRVIKDIAAAKGIITADDLSKYKMAERDVLKTTMLGDLTLQVMGPPSGGAVVAMILNILKGYGFTADDIETDQKKIASYHKIIEAFKFAYARRALMGDPSFLNKTYIKKVVDDLLDQSLADKIRKNRIWTNGTHSNTSYYGGYFGKDDFGTSHVSVLDENGMAVSVTGTINYYFGSGVRSTDTGILYNNEMDDFSSPGMKNLYGYPPTRANFIKPGKRPLSSMSPAVITDKDGKVKMVVGAAGGSMIITGVARTIINKLLFNMELGAAISEPRFHHQLLPDYVKYEKLHPLSKNVVDGLRKLGHTLTSSTSKAVVQGIYVDGSRIYAKADPRKKSRPAGY